MFINPDEQTVGQFKYKCQFCKEWSWKEDWGPGRITCPRCKKIQLSPTEIARSNISQQAESPKPKKDVHTEHCCKRHGCKYSDPTCSVTTGKLPQTDFCEECGYEF